MVTYQGAPLPLWSANGIAAGGLVVIHSIESYLDLVYAPFACSATPQCSVVKDFSNAFNPARTLVNYCWRSRMALS